MTTTRLPVTLPDVAPVTEREHRARTYEAAALHLEVFGWCQGKLNEGERVCLVGAVVAASTTVESLDDLHAWSLDLVPGLREGSVYPMAKWNDEEGRTAAEVAFVLRWRAEEIRDGH